jgi:hypothetical protein
MIHETESGSNRLQPVANLLWKRMWACRKRKLRINEEKSLERDEIRIAGYEELGAVVRIRCYVSCLKEGQPHTTRWAGTNVLVFIARVKHEMCFCAITV